MVPQEPKPILRILVSCPELKPVTSRAVGAVYTYGRVRQPMQGRIFDDNSEM